MGTVMPMPRNWSFISADRTATRSAIEDRAFARAHDRTMWPPPPCRASRPGPTGCRARRNAAPPRRRAATPTPRTGSRAEGQHDGMTLDLPVISPARPRSRNSASLAMPRRPIRARRPGAMRSPRRRTPSRAGTGRRGRRERLRHADMRQAAHHRGWPAVGGQPSAMSLLKAPSDQLRPVVAGTNRTLEGSLMVQVRAPHRCAWPRRRSP